jgi:insulysin
VEAVKDNYILDLSFPISYQAPNFRARPAYYLAHFIAHEGPGSVLAYLKKKGWALDLYAGPQTWNRGVQLFNIFGKLTFAGYCESSQLKASV